MWKGWKTEGVGGGWRGEVYGLGGDIGWVGGLTRVCPVDEE